ncbi:hypothetical protein AVEN_220502-1 [Araneus ventricosus]|uniref:Uncharacterized protein n=1 Tax=Araneus ventricosus TaxID=182803 RepID=A0A4Y2B6V8_ARAVE|nr:hypothetical protein AVEN_220502-1 [Araneus ventricosus]
MADTPDAETVIGAGGGGSSWGALSMERGPWPSSVAIAAGVVCRDVLDCSVVACIDFPKCFFSYSLEVLLDGWETQVFPDPLQY